PDPGTPPYTRGLTYPEFQEWRSRSKTMIDSAAVINMSQRMVKTPDGAAGLWGAAISSNAFEMLKTRASLGRVITRDDESNPDVVVLSNDVWRREYHADPSIIGTALEFRTGALLAPIPPRLLTVIGVMPEGFEFPTGRLDFFIPWVPDPSKQPPRVTMIARLAPGVSLDAATAEAEVMGSAIGPPWPAASPPPSGPRFEIQSLKARAVEPIRPAMRVLLASV